MSTVTRAPDESSDTDGFTADAVVPAVNPFLVADAIAAVVAADVADATEEVDRYVFM
jgi:hypothetical protein